MVDGAEVVARIIAGMPELSAVTLSSRNAGETSPTSVPWAYARCKDPTNEQLMLSGLSINSKTRFIQLYKTTETTEPKALDTITDSESVVWQVKSVNEKMMGYVFDCMCIKNM